MQDLETGERHNYMSNNTAAAATAGVSQQDIEDLSTLLSRLGRSLTQEGHNSVQMVDDVDLIDMELEREVLDPPALDMVDMSEEEQVEEDEEPMGLLEGEEHAITLREDGDVDDRDPPPSLTLSQAKEVSENLFAFVSEHCALVTQAGTSMHDDYVAMADTFADALPSNGCQQALTLGKHLSPSSFPIPCPVEQGCHRHELTCVLNVAEQYVVSIALTLCPNIPLQWMHTPLQWI